jgi:hypothetical protein
VGGSDVTPSHMSSRLGSATSIKDAGAIIQWCRELVAVSGVQFGVDGRKYVGSFGGELIYTWNGTPKGHLTHYSG